MRRGDEKAEGIRPRPIERGQAMEQQFAVAFQPATDQVGDRPGGQWCGCGCGAGAQGFALTLSITFWVRSSDLSAVTIRPSLALTSKIMA
jgi:hypothetical protein